MFSVSFVLSEPHRGSESWGGDQCNDHTHGDAMGTVAVRQVIRGVPHIGVTIGSQPYKAPFKEWEERILECFHHKVKEKCLCKYI